MKEACFSLYHKVFTLDIYAIACRDSSYQSCRCFYVCFLLFVSVPKSHPNRTAVPTYFAINRCEVTFVPPRICHGFMSVKVMHKIHCREMFSKLALFTRRFLRKKRQRLRPLPSNIPLFLSDLGNYECTVLFSSFFRHCAIS